jgi:hypothetical protein
MKMEQFGFSSVIRNWILSFLSGRKQRTSVNGIYSEWGTTKAGVAQGSVLGPLTFLLMINDLPERLINDTRLFADDTCILYSHESNVDMTETINTDLAQLQDWSKPG